MTLAFAALFGLAFGSFANAAIDRLPNRRPLSGRSQCDGCEKPLGPAELVPVASYVAQRGRCKGCGASIGIRTPAVEAGSAFAFAAAFSLLSAPLAIAACAGFVTVAVLCGVELRKWSLHQ